MADSKEAQFQQHIIDAMFVGSWRVGKTSCYDRATALYTEDLLGYMQDVWPERWEKFCKANLQASAQVFAQKVVRELEKAGMLDVLLHGCKAPKVALDLCSFKPDHTMNPEALSRYKANHLRVVPEISYSPHAREKGKGGESYNPRLDLVLFANGIAAYTQRAEIVMAQFNNHIEDKIIHNPSLRCVIDAVLDAITDHEKISMPLLKNEETGWQFAMLILQLLAGRHKAFTPNT